MHDLSILVKKNIKVIEKKLIFMVWIKVNLKV